MKQLAVIIAVGIWIHTHWAGILSILGSLYFVLCAIFGLMGQIVKFFPTLPDGHFLLPIIKILGKITNNQTDDAAIRAQWTQQKK